MHVRRREVPRASINASEGIARDDVWIRIARDVRAFILDASDSAPRARWRQPARPRRRRAASAIDNLVRSTNFES